MATSAVSPSLTGEDQIHGAAEHAGDQHRRGDRRQPIRPSGDCGEAAPERPAARARPRRSGRSRRRAPARRSRAPGRARAPLSQARRNSGSRSNASRAPATRSGGHFEKSAPKAPRLGGKLARVASCHSCSSPAAVSQARICRRARASSDSNALSLTPMDCGRLALRQVLEMEEQDGRALPVRQPLQRVADGADRSRSATSVAVRPARLASAISSSIALVDERRGGGAAGRSQRL